MRKTARTHLFIFDERRLFIEDVRKKFDDEKRYIISSFQNLNEFRTRVAEKHDRKTCRIAITGIQDLNDHDGAVGRVAEEIATGGNVNAVIIISPQDKTEDIRKAIKFNIEECIPRNSNTILRLHNTVKKVFSEHSIGIYTKRRNRAIAVLAAFTILAVILFVFAYLEFPEYF
jgi:DNA-binding NarL/FixJ family response regulator